MGTVDTRCYDYDVVVIGAGAAGMMAASRAGMRGRSVALLEHSSRIGAKIRISGGGRCNFTNLNATSKNYLSENEHFAKSALAKYTQQDFIALVQSYGIAYHEKTLGQLFCDGSSQQIIDMMVKECLDNAVHIKTECIIERIEQPTADGFMVRTNLGIFRGSSLIIATGGLSIPKLGATGFGYKVAKQFGLNIIPQRSALVPLSVAEEVKPLFEDLTGVSNPSVVSYNGVQFRENILFTHKGLSGPAILQISSYMKSFSDQEISINLLPNLDVGAMLEDPQNANLSPSALLTPHLPKRLLKHVARDALFATKCTNLNKAERFFIARQVHDFRAPICGSSGYDKAEVTAGGVDTNELSSKTMEAKKVPGLYFIGEVVDVTGWLGGYNFQWAWSSGYAAGSYA